MATLILNSADIVNLKDSISMLNTKGFSADEGYEQYVLSEMDVIIYREGNKDILLKAPNKE